MSSSLRRWDLFDRVHRVALALGAGTLLIIAALTLVGVFARYVLSRPLAGITELTGEGLMVVLIYLSLSSAHHIRVSLVVNKLPVLGRRLVSYLVLAVTGLVLAIAVYAAYEGAITSMLTGEATTGITTIDIYPFRFIVTLGLALSLLRVIQLRTRWLSMSHDESLPDDARATDDDPASARPGADGDAPRGG